MTVSNMTRKMKDSGIEWIGEIPEEWDLVKGKYLFKLRTTKGNTKNVQLLSPTQNFGVIPQELYEKLTGMRPVKLKSDADLQQMRTIYKGDYCISLRSFQGGFEYSKYDGIVSPAYQVFYPYKKISSTYYRYLFKDSSFIQKINSFTISLRDGKNIAFSDFGNIDIPFPTFVEQNKIAKFLNKKVSEINQTSQAIQQEIDALEEYRKSLITETVTKGLDKNVPMKDSGIEWIGEIPENWKVEKLKYLVETRESKILLSDVQYSYIGLENIEKNTGKYISTDSTYENQYYNFCEKGDILYSKLRPNLSKAIIAPFAACCTGEFEVIKSTKLHKKYILYYLLSNYVTDATNAAIYGTKMPRVSWNYVKNLRVVFPNQSEDQIKIVNYLDKKLTIIDQIVRQKQQQLNHLDKYKQSIIYEYVTGKKQVPEKEGVKNAQ